MTTYLPAWVVFNTWPHGPMSLLCCRLYQLLLQAASSITWQAWLQSAAMLCMASTGYGCIYHVRRVLDMSCLKLAITFYSSGSYQIAKVCAHHNLDTLLNLDHWQEVIVLTGCIGFLFNIQMFCLASSQRFTWFPSNCLLDGLYRCFPHRKPHCIGRYLHKCATDRISVLSFYR